MVTITRDAIVREVTEQTGRATQTDVREVVEVLLALIREHAEAGDTVRFTGFGSFRVKARPARTGRNPATGEPLTIPETRRLHFKPSKAS